MFAILNAAQTFTPAVYAPSLWIDINDVNGNGSVPSNGTAIESLIDKTGIHAPITQSTSSQRAIYTHNVQNGKPGLLFDGATNMRYYPCSDPLLSKSQACTIFSLSMPTGSAGTRRFIIENITASGVDLTVSQEYTTANLSAVFMGDGAASTINVTGGAATLNQPFIYCSTYDGGTTNALKFYRNGAFIGQATRLSAGNSSANTGFNIGTFRSANSRWFHGYIFEIICYNRLFSANEIARVLSYLSQKWGVTI